MKYLLKNIIGKAPLLLILLAPGFNRLRAQVKTENTSGYTLSNAHSHNDYKNDIPFYRAYYKGFGSIEADIFPVNGELLVAHSKDELDAKNTLSALYLKPAIETLEKDTLRRLNLLIDIKENYKEALATLITQLRPYQALLKSGSNNGRLTITISGSRPEPANYGNYPDYIYFDGIWPLNDESNRTEMVSLDFSALSKWNGKGRLDHADYTRIKDVIDSVHAAGKKIRFWATPDTKSAWLALMQLHADLIGTDVVESFGDFLKKLPKNSFIGIDTYKSYLPTYKSDGILGNIKNIILLIGDGMGLAQIYSAYTANLGELNIFKMLNIGLSVTNAADTYITDSAAGGTAMAGGQKTNNRAIGVDTSGTALKSLASYAAEAGKKTAIISVGDLTDATPAAFYAHQTDRAMQTEIANDMPGSGINILLGSGVNHFLKKTDGATAAEKLKIAGYTVTYSFEDFKKSNATNLIGIVPDKDTRPKINGRNEFLTESFISVSNKLINSPKGFFMMLEGAQIDYGGHQNNLSQVITENLDFDKVVGKALEFADKDGQTLVIVTADHETGGLTLVDGDLKKGYVMGEFSTNDHTAIPVPVFAYGPHSNEFRGVYQNTEIFRRLLKLIR